MRYILLLLYGSFLLLSCSQDLQENNIPATENVNGFKLKWRKNVSPQQQDVIRTLLNNMIKVEGGTFVLGATPEQTKFARGNEYPPCHVRLSDFYICKYEVTEEQYLTITEDSRASGISSLSLSWDDWHLFIQTLQEMSGVNFDFPTEAQWEYAAKGGIYSKGYIYPGSNNLEEVWSGSKLEGSSVPNELGLYNMADMKSEWCKDRYETYLGNKIYVDRYIDEGQYRVVRGGNYHCYGESPQYMNDYSDYFGYFKTPGATLSSSYDYRYCRSTARSYYYTQSESVSGTATSLYIGCRLVINNK